MSSNMIGEEKMDPRVKRTRSLLVQAFVELLAEKDFQLITVRDISERATVNRTTFYLHYPDKFALLDYSASQLFHKELEKRSLNICHYSPENLRSLIIAVAEFVAFSNSHCKSYDAQFEALIELQVKRQVQEILVAWEENLATPMDNQLAAIAGSWAIYGLALDWSHAKKRDPVEAFAENITSIIDAILGLAQPERER